MSQSPPKIIENVYILPCLQEIRKFGEIEQEPGKIDKNGDIITIPSETYLRELTGPARVLTGQQGSKVFNKHWFDDKNPKIIGKSIYKIFDDPRKHFIVPKISVPKTLEYKKCSEYPDGIEWATLLKFMVDRMRNNNVLVPTVTPNNTLRNISNITENEYRPSQEGTTVTPTTSLMLVSHHNRIKKSYFPLKDKNICNGYANCMCFKVTFKKQGQIIIPEVTIINGGFPDQDKYVYCDKKNVIEQVISTTKLENGISLLENNNALEKCSIYLIRHGNSLHNKPVNRKTLDSVLTPFGMYQAYKVGKILKEESDFKNNELIIGTSFLSRSQLTALEILDAMGKIGTNLKSDLKILRYSAFKRFEYETKVQLSSSIVKELDPHYNWRENVDEKSVLQQNSKTYLKPILEEYRHLHSLIGGKTKKIRKKQRKTINKRKNKKINKTQKRK